MPPVKIERIGKMRGRRDKVLAASAHRLLIYMLSGTYGITPTPDQWAVSSLGKPYLLDTDVHFNISHSGDMAMCAVSDSPVGVDIEKMRPVSDAVPKRVFSDEEMKVFEATADRDAMFFAIWTLKEAYIKYLGTGMRTPLWALTMYPRGGAVVSNMGDCAFALFDGIDGYRAAVCAKQPFADTPEWVDANKLDSF